MNFLNSFLGRRRFLIAFISSTIALVFGSLEKVLDFIFIPGSAKASNGERTKDRKSLKGIVVYYSATASTAKIANAIYKGMKSVIDCDVAPLKKIDPGDMAKYDVMAIGAPIWLSREPANIKVFTNSMARMDGKYCILFCTHGTGPWNIFWSMSRNLLKKGLTIIGWNDWYGDATHVVHAAQPYITHGHPDEIDLQEAEAFGREMAERANRITAGEKGLIPEIPIPAEGENHLWAPKRTNGRLTFASPPPDSTPKINFTRCVYPRCTQCIDNCPVNALDFSLTTPAGLTDSLLSVKEACQHCGGLCQRVCFYDAITYVGEKTEHVIDMKKCTYPKCTLCVDECLMDAIDFFHNPPLIHNRCEGCDVCWCICPEGAVDIPNLYEVQARKGWWFTSTILGLVGDRIKGEETGEGEDAPVAEVPGMGMHMVKFRQLLPDEEIGKEGKPMYSKKIPRIVLNKADWPYHISEG